MKLFYPVLAGGVILISLISLILLKDYNFSFAYSIGQKIDSLNGVYVYYNGTVGNISGRNLSADNYNLGLKYQCVEFIKRYYYEYYNHKMPDSYGHAKDFFDKSLSDGALNKSRNLIQYTNPGKSKPRVGDILIFAPTASNEFGHVAIISGVKEEEIEVIQQNPGPFAKSRITFPLRKIDGIWEIDNDRILGWLRKK